MKSSKRGKIGHAARGRLAGASVAGMFETGMRRLNERHPWSHNDHFHSWTMANMPEPCRTVLDVGCGRGELLAALATRVGTVIGNDIDPRMRQEAARRCAGLPNVSVVDQPWVEMDGLFDAVTMIAVPHHLDARDALREVSRLLVPGGHFLAVGLAVPRSFVDYLWEPDSFTVIWRKGRPSQAASSAELGATVT